MAVVKPEKVSVKVIYEKNAEDYEKKVEKYLLEGYQPTQNLVVVEGHFMTQVALMEYPEAKPITEENNNA